MALMGEARTCFCGVLLGLSVLLIPLIGSCNDYFGQITHNYWRYILAADIALVNVILVFIYKGHSYQIAIRSCLLGLTIGVGVILTFSESSLRLFGWYLTMLAFFHWSEYFTTAVANPRNLSLDSFLLDHSPEYHIAALASVVEFVVESYFFPDLKQPSCVSIIGLLMVLGGEVLRKASMITASTNFNHYVQHIKQQGHRLVTWGVYGLARHPAYVGWFYWSIGTQLMLCNPICLIGYTVASWRFFRFRIEHEELMLLNFFGEDYIDYQQKVRTGLPFIEGYKMEL